MRVWISIVGILILTVLSAKAQYFYKDILLTRQNQENWKLLRDQKIREVNIQSLDANSEATPGFTCKQVIAPDFSAVATFTQSANIPASTLTTYYDPNGRILKTVDTSDTYKSTTDYTYNESGDISTLLNTSVETDNHTTASEKHVWQYEGKKPVLMIKIRNETDSTTVNLVKDEAGNITEEKPVRGAQHMPSVYYYYDNAGRLTDIVRYSQRAARLLPDYVFEYDNGRIASMLSVRTGSTDYQKWQYTYNTNGLKATETCYDKRRQVVVKINYAYSPNSR